MKISDPMESGFQTGDNAILESCDQGSSARSHYLERASVLDFKDAATLRFGHRDVVFDLFTETHFLHLITLLSNFQNCLAVQVSLDQIDITLCQKYHKFGLLSISDND